MRRVAMRRPERQALGVLFSAKAGTDFEYISLMHSSARA